MNLSFHLSYEIFFSPINIYCAALMMRAKKHVPLLPNFLSLFNEEHIVIKLHNIKFHKNPFSYFRIVTCDHNCVVKLTGSFLQLWCLSVMNYNVFETLDDNGYESPQ